MAERQSQGDVAMPADRILHATRLEEETGKAVYACAGTLMRGLCGVTNEDRIKHEVAARGADRYTTIRRERPAQSRASCCAAPPDAWRGPRTAATVTGRS